MLILLLKGILKLTSIKKITTDFIVNCYIDYYFFKLLTVVYFCL